MADVLPNLLRVFCVATLSLSAFWTPLAIVVWPARIPVRKSSLFKRGTLNSGDHSKYNNSFCFVPPNLNSFGGEFKFVLFPPESSFLPFDPYCFTANQKKKRDDHDDEKVAPKRRRTSL
jgi:hypothetical protein